MPIMKDEWEGGRRYDTLEGQILKWLQKNPNQAFTEQEIREALSRRIPGDLWVRILGDIGLALTMHGALQTLLGEGKILAKKVDTPIGEQLYYMIAT